MPRALIKYIHIKDATRAEAMHTLADYEHTTARIEHTSFDDLVSKVKENCPSSFQCLYPLALHHEILWTINGERDQVFRPIDEQEYARIDWTVGSVTSLCVEIQASGEPRNAAKGPALLLASLGRTYQSYSPRGPAGALRLR